MTPDEYLSKCLGIIAEKGHVVQYVFGPEGAEQPPFGYTVGLSTGQCEYELAVSGLPYDGAVDVLNQAVAALQQSGMAPSEGLVLDRALADRFAIKLREAHPAAPFPMIDQITGARSTVWQVLWPDPRRRFPDDERYKFNPQQDFSLPPTPRDNAHTLAMTLLKTLTPGVVQGIGLARIAASTEGPVTSALAALRAWTDTPRPDHPIKVVQLLPAAASMASLSAGAISITHGRGAEAADRWLDEQAGESGSELQRAAQLIRQTTTELDDAPTSLSRALGEAIAHEDGAFRLVLALAYVTARALAAALGGDQDAILGLLDQCTTLTDH